MANVVKDVCSSNYDGNIMKVADKMVGFAKAWARVRLTHPSSTEPLHARSSFMLLPSPADYPALCRKDVIKQQHCLGIG